MPTRRGVVSREVLNLNDVIQDYLGSVVHLQKRLMKLVTNRIEAREDSGKIYISTNNQYSEGRDLFYQRLPAGDYVVLSIEDEGTGIDPHDWNRLFEPFYTTKVMARFSVSHLKLNLLGKICLTN